MTRLIVIRHGQSVANEEDKFAGHSDFDLTDLGRTQAELAAEYIKAHFKVDAAYASDLKRAYNTALPTARAFGLEVHGDQGLREIFAGEWEAMDFSKVISDYGEDFVLWRDDFAAAYCPGGETVAELSKRVCDTVQRICKDHDGETVLIATHASPVRAIQSAASGESTSDINFVSNASINLFTYDNGKLAIKALNIVDHLGDLRTDLPASLENNPKQS